MGAEINFLKPISPVSRLMKQSMGKTEILSIKTDHLYLNY